MRKQAAFCWMLAFSAFAATVLVPRQAEARACSVDSDCPKGFACLAGGVAPDGGPAGECMSLQCLSNSDCGPALSCDFGVGTRCTTTPDGGQACSPNDICVPQWDAPCITNSDADPGTTARRPPAAGGSFSAAKTRTPGTFPTRRSRRCRAATCPRRRLSPRGQASPFRPSATRAALAPRSRGARAWRSKLARAGPTRTAPRRGPADVSSRAGRSALPESPRSMPVARWPAFPPTRTCWSRYAPGAWSQHRTVRRCPRRPGRPRVTPVPAVRGRSPRPRQRVRRARAGAAARSGPAAPARAGPSSLRALLPPLAGDRDPEGSASGRLRARRDSALTHSPP
jgi:hypothetical protein